MSQETETVDAMEREKKFEYKVLYRRQDGRVYSSTTYAEDIQTARDILGIYSGYDEAHIVRREVVGEWEACK